MPRLPFTRVVVRGDSMLPALEPGDRLLVRRTRRVRPGDLAVVADPREPDRLLVKRVIEAGTDVVVLAGDNADASTDSATFGPVPRSGLIGRAVYRYSPPGRAGRVG